MNEVARAHYLELAPIVAIGAVVAGASLSARVPLTSDESWNYHFVSQRGIKYAFTSYEFPNNHILFSAVQSVLPSRLIARWPPNIRVLNVFYVLALLLFLRSLLKTHLRSGAQSALGASAILLCSPLFTLYLFVARGYLLGAVLLLLALSTAASGDKYPWAGVLAGLATVCVPTFALALPAVIAVASLAGFQRGGARRSFIAGAVVAAVHCAIAGVVYIPIRNIVLENRKSWTTGVSLRSFFSETLFALANHVLASVLLLSALLIFLAVLLLRRAQKQGRAPELSTHHLLIVGLVLACGSYYLLVSFLTLSKLSNPPFTRNGMFAPLFLWLSLLLFSVDTPRWMGRLITAFAVGNALIGLVALGAFWPGMDPNGYPAFAIQGPTPAQAAFELRHNGIAIDALETTELGEVATLFYSDALDVPLRRIAAAAMEMPCAVRSSRPPATQTVVAVSSRRRFLLCY